MIELRWTVLDAPHARPQLQWRSRIVVDSTNALRAVTFLGHSTRLKREVTMNAPMIAQ